MRKINTYKMKIILSSLLALSLLNVNAQKRFEGTIVYRVYEGTGLKVKEETELSVEFGKPGIRLNVIQKGTAAESIIFNLDSAAQYDLDTRIDSYRKKAFEKKEKTPPLPTSRDFQGYQADVVDLSENSNAKIFGSSNRGRVIAYPAKDLLFPVPEEYAASMELSMLYKGKVLLGFTMISKVYADKGEKYDTVEVRAISITPGTIAASRFEVPKGLTMVVVPTYDDLVDSAVVYDAPAPYMVDSAVEVMADTVAEAYPVPAPPVKTQKPASAVKKKPATPKSPMRKPKQ